MRILVIEDEPDLRRIVGRALAEEGYTVDSAANGEEGLTKAKIYDYDAIVLDLMLPRVTPSMNSCRRCWAQTPSSPTPAISLT